MANNNEHEEFNRLMLVRTKKYQFNRLRTFDATYKMTKEKKEKREKTKNVRMSNTFQCTEDWMKHPHHRSTYNNLMAIKGAFWTSNDIFFSLSLSINWKLKDVMCIRVSILKLEFIGCFVMIWILRHIVDKVQNCWKYDDISHIQNQNSNNMIKYCVDYREEFQKWTDAGNLSSFRSTATSISWLIWMENVFVVFFRLSNRQLFNEWIFVASNFACVFFLCALFNWNALSLII